MANAITRAGRGVPAFAATTGYEAFIGMTTDLVTGFGPFPGALFNPKQDFVKHLARLRRPAPAGVKPGGDDFKASLATRSATVSKALLAS